MAAARLFAALVVLLVARPAAAQEPTPPAPAAAAAPAAPAAPTPIAAPEVVTRADETKARLKQVEANVAPDATETEIQTKLADLEAKVVERAPRAEALLGSESTSLDALFDLAGEWGSRADKLTEWRLALTRRAVAVEAELDALAAEEATWKATLDAGASGAFPAITLERVREVLGALNETEKLVKKRRTQILSRQNDVAQQELVVSGLIDRIDARRTELRSRILARDAPPLWAAEAWVPPEGAPALATRIREAMKTSLADLQEFANRSGAELAFALACFLIVLVALSLARESAARAGEADASLAAAARIFARPVSAAVVIAVMASAPLFRRTPGVVDDLQRLLVLVPILRIMPVELWHGFRPGLLALAALFVTTSTRSLLASAPILDRLLLLAEALSGAGLFLWLSRPEKGEVLATIGRFAGTVRPVAGVGVALLVGAALANLTGLVSASRLVVRATLSSAFVAVAFYAVSRILAGILTVLLRSEHAQRLRTLRDYGALVRRRTLTGLYWGATALWALTTLRLFRISDDVWDAGASVLTAKLELGTVSLSLGDVVAFGLTLWVASLLSRFLRFVLEGDVLPHIALPRGVANAISTSLHYAILIVGFVLAIGAAGIDLSRFTLLAGAFGVGIGFGLQNVVNNFVSGLILLFERPVQVGDSVDVGGVSGDITRIGIRSSTLRTAEGADVIVPNATLISDRVVNWTFSDRSRRIDIDVGVKYGTDPEKVIALLVATGRAHAEVLAIPEPLALFLRFGDSALDFQLRVWTRFEIAVRVRSEVAMAVHTALRDAGMEIPFPQRELHVKVEPGTPTYILPGTPEGG